MDFKSLTLLRGVYLHQKYTSKNPSYGQIIEEYVEANHEHDSDAVKNLVVTEVVPLLDNLIEKNFLEISPCGSDIYLITESGKKVIDCHMTETIKEGSNLNIQEIVTQLENLLKEEQDEDPSSSHSSTPKPRFHYPDPSEN